MAGLGAAAGRSTATGEEEEGGGGGEREVEDGRTCGLMYARPFFSRIQLKCIPIAHVRSSLAENVPLVLQPRFATDGVADHSGRRLAASRGNLKVRIG